jgi:hypothetical protein
MGYCLKERKHLLVNTQLQSVVTSLIAHPAGTDEARP